MNTPVKTPKKKGRGKRRRTDFLNFSLSPGPPNLIDDDDGDDGDGDGNDRDGNDEYTDASEDVLFTSATDHEEFEPSTASTDGTMTGEPLNASPEIIEQVRSIDALMASQNDTLGSLMNTPSGARSTPGDDDDDYMRMEQLGLDRYADQLRQEINALESRHHHTPLRSSRTPQAPTALLTPPLARVMSVDDDDDDNDMTQFEEAQYGTYHVPMDSTLDLTASPIHPSGSNANTPASSAPPNRRRYPQHGGAGGDQPPPPPAPSLSVTPLRSVDDQPRQGGQQPPPSTSSSSSGTQQQTTSSSSSSGGGLTSDSSSMTVMFVDKNSSASDSDMNVSTMLMTGYSTPASTAQGVDAAAAGDDHVPPPDSPASSAKVLAKGVLVPSPGGHRTKAKDSQQPQPSPSQPTEVVAEPSDQGEATSESNVAMDPPPVAQPPTTATSSPLRRNLFREVLRTPVGKSKRSTALSKPPTSAPTATTTTARTTEPTAPSSAVSSFSPARLRSLVTGAMGGGGKGSAKGPTLFPPPPPLSTMPHEVATSSNAADDAVPTTAVSTSPPPSSPAASGGGTTASSLSPEVLRTAAALGLLDDDDDDADDDNDNDDDQEVAGGETDAPNFISPSSSQAAEEERANFPREPDEETTGANTSDDWIVSSPSTASTASGGGGDRARSNLMSTTLTTAATSTTWDSSDPVEGRRSPRIDTIAADTSKAVQRTPSVSTPFDAKGGKVSSLALGAAAHPDEKTIRQSASLDSEANSLVVPAAPKKSDTTAVDDSDCFNRRRRCEFTLGSLLLLFVLFASLVILIVTSVVLTREQRAPVPPPSAVSPSVSPVTSSSPTPLLRRPTVTPSATPAQPPASQSLFDYLVSISPDDGAALRNSSSPQYQAFLWLSSNDELSSYSPMRLRQRFVLATFYYSTNGANWDVSTNWMTNENECNWFSRALFATVCGRGYEFQRLELSYNNLDGSLPKELSLLSDTLQNMSLSGGPDRFLTGTIPTELGALTNLWNLRLWNNQLTGPGFPTELGQLSNLKYLDVSMNDLSGRIGTEIGRLTTMTWLDMSNNRITGRIPWELGNSLELMFLDLGSNGLTGNVPPTFGNLTKLLTLRLDSNSLDRINANVGMMSSLESISMANNVLVGSIPDSIGRLANLQRLNLTMNLLNGTLPTSIRQLTMLSDVLDLSHNRLSGSIPSWLGANNSLLRVMLLNSNSFNGTVPTGLAGLARANVIRLDSTNLVGEVPADVCETVNETLAILFADCSEVSCPCCTYCCDDASKCSCVYEGTIDDWKCYY